AGIALLMELAIHDDRMMLLLRSAADSADFYQAAGLDRGSRLRVRNAALAEAFEILSADGCGPWVAAKRLVAAVQRFEMYVWPRLSVPGRRFDLSPVESALHRAFLTGEKVPGDAGYLYALLK
ncbi:MAG: hypothetical protein JWR74_2778, partial [Polaromonas sp.]|nr:hypothetical protein [Polaromonas sp.]